MSLHFDKKSFARLGTDKMHGIKTKDAVLDWLNIFYSDIDGRERRRDQHGRGYQEPAPPEPDQIPQREEKQYKPSVREEIPAPIRNVGRFI